MVIFPSFMTVNRKLAKLSGEKESDLLIQKLEKSVSLDESENGLTAHSITSVMTDASSLIYLPGSGEASVSSLSGFAFSRFNSVAVGSLFGVLALSSSLSFWTPALKASTSKPSRPMSCSPGQQASSR